MSKESEKNSAKRKTLTSQNQKIEITGAEALVRSLNEEGVRHIWGYPGDALLHIYEALSQQKEVEHLLVRHEQAAVHAADGYARATGKVGVALVSSGSGVTNAVTGIAAAYLDSIPLVIISGQVSTAYIGQDAFQECDAIGITRPVVKHNILVNNVAELAPAIKKAFHIASTGRPGPVLVDIPKDISAQLTHFKYPEKVEMRSYAPVLKGHTGQIKKALQLLTAAKCPCIYSGGGVISSAAEDQLAKLLELLDAPLVTTLMGLGGYPGTNPRSLGMAGMHGTVEANMTLQECDVLLAIGARFDDRVIANTAHYMQRPRKVIHIDIDPSSISKRIKADLPIVGSVREVLDEMLELLQKQEYKADTTGLAPWWKQINQWRKQDCLSYDRDNKDVIKPQKIIETLWDLTHQDDIYITSDVGQHQMWVAQHYRFNQARRWISSGGLGAMGVGLPYALGVKKAFPKAEVFCITSEGSIQKNIQELATSSQHQLPVIILALNNSYLGMARQWHEQKYEGCYSHSYMDSLPNFVKLAEAYGHVGILVEKPQDIETAIKEARKIKDRTVFIDFRTDPSEYVFPMVPDDKGLDEMILRNAGGDQK